LLKSYKDPLVAGVNYAAIPYGASQWKALTEYTTGASIFTNTNSADCGEVTNCYPKATGCTDAYSTGKVSIDGGTQAISITQNEDAGYTETLCIVCENSVGDKVEHDNWIIE
jgi:hypothetical protein